MKTKHTFIQICLFIMRLGLPNAAQAEFTTQIKYEANAAHALSGTATRPVVVQIGKEASSDFADQKKVILPGNVFVSKELFYRLDSGSGGRSERTRLNKRPSTSGEQNRSPLNAFVTFEQSALAVYPVLFVVMAAILFGKKCWRCKWIAVR